MQMLDARGTCFIDPSLAADTVAFEHISLTVDISSLGDLSAIVVNYIHSYSSIDS